jgi:peptidoglycan/LPS O-acetylase OafA/YrhL
MVGWLVEGHGGVGLFFVLSGFLFMHIARVAPAIPWGASTKNRLLRIFPLFVVVFVVATSIRSDDFWPADLRYLHCCCALYFFSAQSTHMYYSTLVGHFDQFPIGMASAFLARRVSMLRERRPHGIRCIVAGALVEVLLGLVARHASYQLPQPMRPVRAVWRLVEALMWSFAIVAYTSWRGSVEGVLGMFLGMVGESSYSPYLWHGVVLYLFAKLTGATFDTVNWRIGMCVAH